MPDTRPIVSDGLPDMSDFPPVYLYKDAEGRDYTLQMPSVDAAERPHGRGNGLRKRYLVAEDRALLARTKLKVKYLPDLDLEAAADKANKIGCNGTLPPTSYTMFGNGGEHSVGSVAICKINVARPPNSHTHWIQLIVATYRVASNQVHVPVVAWFKPELHGHGMYFGDTSFFPCANNGQSAANNTRIEAWSQWPGYGPARSSPLWQSTGPSYSDTCGTAWLDTHINIDGTIQDTGRRYRVTVHANDGQAVMYSVDKRVGAGSWQVHTAPLWKNVTYAANWPADPYFSGPVYGQFDSSANGLALIGATSSGTAVSWFVAVTSLGTGWF